MGDRTVHGVVVRYANFSESSRMLTLFTLEAVSYTHLIGAGSVHCNDETLCGAERRRP